MFLWRIIYCLIFNQTPDAQYCYQAMSNLFILYSYKKRHQIIEINTIAITGLLQNLRKISWGCQRYSIDIITNIQKTFCFSS